MPGASSLRSSTRTTTLSIASANSAGTASSASATSSSKRACDISTGIASPTGLVRRGRLARRWWRVLRRLPDAPGDRREPAVVRQLRPHLTVHQRGSRVPALLLPQIPSQDQVLRVEIDPARVALHVVAALGVQPGRLILLR